MIYFLKFASARTVARLVVVCAGLLIACQPSPTVSPPAGSSAAPAGTAASAQMREWEELVAAARREGELNLYGAISGGIRDALIEPFEKAHPGIKVSGTFAPANDLVPRILAEREAKRYIPDVIVGPATQAVLVLKPAGGVAPLEPAFLHPEVTDLSLWYQNRRWWVDAAEPYTTMAFQAYVGTSITYNSQMVDPREFTSFRDLLNPKWKGKIVSNDIRRPGQGSVQVRFIYSHADLGPAFLGRLFSEMDITLSTDHRQMVDWIAQGRYPIGLWISSTQMKAAAELGLPVGEIPGDQLREGAPLSVGGGTINLADSPPHPNAARVFVNWLLSRDGQLSWQQHVQQPSLRLDVPRDGLDPTGVPKPDVRYVDGGTEEYLLRVPSDNIAEIVNRGLTLAPR